MSRSLRPVAAPFVAAAPAGARVRTRLRVSAQDEAVLRAVGRYLGSLAGRDLAARCAEGRLDAKGRAVSRARRKRALTAESSSRWAGAITRTSEDQVRLAGQNLRAEASGLRARIRRIEARLPVPAAGRPAGCAATRPGRSGTPRWSACRCCAAGWPGWSGGWGRGRCGWCGAGRRCCASAGTSAPPGPPRHSGGREWELARLFLTADGEKDKAQGNETIRWHPGQGWLEIRLPAPLADLANRPHSRYRLPAPVGSPTGTARSPPRRPPGRSVTTSAVTRCGAGGIWTHRGRPRPHPRRARMSCGRTRCWRST